MSVSPRRGLVAAVLALLALVAAACGGGSGAAEAPRDAEPVTVRHAGGETTLEGVPERVVILDDAMLGDVLPFGVVPVGTAAATTDPTVIAEWREEAGVDEIRNVAPDFAPNLEAIAAVRPDLILAMAWQVEEEYWDALNRIAPTVAVETDVNPEALEPRFDEVALRTYGEVFRQPDVADRIVREYEERVARIAEEFADVAGGTTVSFATSYEGGQARLDGPTGWAGAILADVGFSFPEVQLDAIARNKDFPVRHEFSAEQAPRFLGTDVVIWRVADGRPGVRRGFPRAATEANPLLERLPAAAAGRVFTVSERTWFLRSVRGRMVVLDQLEGEILPGLRER